MDALARDLRLALRSLRRAPAFTITTVLILALAIGMASAMFTVLDAVLLKRLPLQDPGRLVELSAVGRGAASSELPLSVEQYRRFSAETRSVQSVAGFAHWRVSRTVLKDGDRLFTLRLSAVTGNFFQVLGVRPALGHMFRSEDAPDWGAAASNRDLALVLSYDTWRRAFDGDSTVIGRRLEMPIVNWHLTIVGVAPPGLDYPRGTESWLAANYQGLDLVARLAPGATPAAARHDFQTFLGNDPDIVRIFGSHTVGAQVRSLSEMVVGGVRAALWALSGAVGLLLLLACVNIANLQLLRAAGRARELAIRRTLGARSGHLARQLLTENAVLASAGGALGLALATLLLRVLPRFAPEVLPRTDMVALAGAPIAVSGVVTLLAVLLFGVVPPLGALRFDPSSPLRMDLRAGTAGRRLRRIRQALVAWQIALALVVLSGAALLGRSFARLADLSLGYPTGHLSVLEVTLPWQQWVAQCGGSRPGLSAADSARLDRCATRAQFDYHERIMASVREVPAVMSVSPEVVPPFYGASVWMTKVGVEGQSVTEAQRGPFFALDGVGADYFRTFGIPILRGRAFTDADREDAPPVAIVTEGVAKRLWPNQQAVGKRFYAIPGAADSLVTVIGVVPDFHYRILRAATPTILRPFRQLYAQGTFVARIRGPLGSAVPMIRRAVAAADPGAELLSARSMDELIAPQLSQPRFDALLLAVFGLAALVLAAIGLYGIMASGVAQQTREFGVRMALGATPERLRGMVLGQALQVTAVGGAVGLAAALAGSRVLTSLLFEVSPTDPVALLGACALLVGVALLAALMPAERATRIDPAQVMQAE